MVQLMPLPSPNPIVSCLIYIQTGFTLLVPACPGCHGKEAVKRVWGVVIVVVVVVVVVDLLYNMTLPTFAAEHRRLQLSIDICCRRPRSAANQPHAAAAVDRRDSRTDGHQTLHRRQRQ